MTIYSRITGTGGYLPPRRLTNADLVAELAAQGIESSDEWIVERTGIRARHFVDAGVGSSDLGAEAARKAIEAAGCEPSDIDLIIVATSTPDMVFPSTAALLQNKLGIVGCPAFDVQAVCSGFIYAMTVADAMIKTGTAKRALVIGAEVFSRILDFKDRTTCVLFGDGAGAVVLEASETDVQRQRLQKRIDNPERSWKHDPSDLSDREIWPKYEQAYEDVLRETSRPHAPWYVIPADVKWVRDLAVAKIILKTLQEMDPKVPVPSKDLKKIVVPE